MQILREDSALAKCRDPSGQSMLHLACIFNLSDIALALIAAGADPNDTNSFGTHAFT
jgi:ankyrin repeat protein